jgi:hypothetical protein
LSGGYAHAMVTLKNGIAETLRRKIDPELLV